MFKIIDSFQKFPSYDYKINSIIILNKSKVLTITVFSNDLQHSSYLFSFIRSCTLLMFYVHTIWINIINLLCSMIKLKLKKINMLRN